MRIVIVVVIGLLAGCGGAQSECVTTTPPPAPMEPEVIEAPPPTTAQWDDAATAELTAFFRSTMQVWESRDLAAVERTMGTEGVPSFDYDMQGAPVTWPGREEVLAAAREMFAGMEGFTATSEISSLDCRATATVGLCAAQIEANVSGPGMEFSFPYRATMAAYRGPDGWVTNHWHSSPNVDFARWGEAGITPLADVEWQAMPAGNGEIQIGVVATDPATGRTVMFVKVPRRWEHGRHIHTAPYHAVVVAGSFTVTQEGGQPVEMRVGTYARGLPNVVHTSSSARGATLLVVTDGRLMTLDVDEQGNPVPPAPPAADGE